ncbi:NAD-dependent deacylase [Pseudenhygromyxa sp. WMMC2535]|uniref:NAD-dependent protein deacylase n=1 Tax=Pseudenhygromyxa sp. WMMC2535 TaxID=2712867 RepID=UPI00155716DA|nr:NAD-dependent deacylase [Pseudenhygromyxa sp. WMMC2535]
MSAALDIRDFERVVFFTGAGMSAESGVPTYRGKGGIWKSYDYQNCACQEAFERDPEYVWEFHNYRRGLVSKCAPNLGHQLITRCQQQLPSVRVVTQNIDGLHQAAGSVDVLELHGSLWRVHCEACGWSEEDHAAPVLALRCPACGDAYKRPGIVWFGDPLNEAVIREVADALAACDLLVSIGTSAVVYPAAQMPLIAKRGGATLVEINPEDTPISHAYDHHLRTTATEGLAALCAGLDP